MAAVDGARAQGACEVITSASEMRAWSRAARARGLRVGFVPTMGALHDGHLSLVRAARARADVVVVSIYVNETQFAPGEDFDKYPREVARDVAKLDGVGGVDVAYVPRAMYVDPEKEAPHETFVTVENVSKGLCSLSRPHFFRGVATVVTKLFNVVEPDVAAFGKKDYQQWRVIQRMVRDLDFGIDVVGGEIVRESDGLAMSSRNALLTPENRAKAPAIRACMSRAAEDAQSRRMDASEIVRAVTEGITNATGVVDYVKVMHPETLVEYEGVVESDCVVAIAAKFGDVRLLDNIEISIPR